MTVLRDKLRFEFLLGSTCFMVALLISACSLHIISVLRAIYAYPDAAACGVFNSSRLSGFHILQQPFIHWGYFNAYEKSTLFCNRHWIVPNQIQRNPRTQQIPDLSNVGMLCKCSLGMFGKPRLSPLYSLQCKMLTLEPQRQQQLMLDSKK